METIEFWVYGTPVPQGSTRSFYIKKTEQVVTTHGNKSTSAWRQRIATEAQEMQKSFNFYTSDKHAYTIDMLFLFERPKSKPKKIVDLITRPDLDKLVRACLDGITGVLITDDALIDDIHAKKKYCENDQPPGLRIRLTKRP